MNYTRSKYVGRNRNSIHIYRMDNPQAVSDFSKSIFDGINDHYNDFEIIISSQVTAIFPNACLPIAAIIDYYRTCGVKFSFSTDHNSYIAKVGFCEPFSLTKDEISQISNPFDKIIKYSLSEQVAEYTQRCIDYISRTIICEDGVLKSLIWCINEVMDNVLVHSNEKSGYVLSQFHPSSKHIAICVFDSGIGIFNSLKNAKNKKHCPQNSRDAITFAIQKGVGDGRGQGNGLFGLYSIIEQNQGRLSITSGSSSVLLDEEHNTSYRDKIRYLSSQKQCTTVDFQLDLNKKIDINRAFSSIGGFDGFDIRLDNMLQDNDCILYNIMKNCEGTATRDAGEHLRNDIINTMSRSNSRMTLDFSEVHMASSSFLDECLSKLVVYYGIITFIRLFDIKGMNETIKNLAENSIYTRISNELNQ